MRPVVLPAAATANHLDERCDRRDQPGNRVYHKCEFENRHRILLVLSAFIGVM